MSKTFWLILTVICIAWYFLVTIYVGIKGASDIKQMLARLAQSKMDAEADEQ